MFLPEKSERGIVLARRNRESAPPSAGDKTLDSIRLGALAPARPDIHTVRVTGRASRRRDHRRRRFFRGVDVLRDHQMLASEPPEPPPPPPEINEYI